MDSSEAYYRLACRDLQKQNAALKQELETLRGEYNKILMDMSIFLTTQGTIDPGLVDFTEQYPIDGEGFRRGT